MHTESEQMIRYVSVTVNISAKKVANSIYCTLRN